MRLLVGMATLALSACSGGSAANDAGADATTEDVAQPDAGAEAAADAFTCPTGLVMCGGACVDLQGDPNHCGSCDASCGDGVVLCCGGQCAANAGTPLVQKQFTNAVAIDAQNIYYDGSFGKDVTILPKIGGSPVTLASNIGSVERLAVDATNVYVATAGNGVFAVPIAGADGGVPPALVPSLDSRALAIDSSTIYYGASSVGLAKIAKIGGQPTTLDAADDVFAIATDGSFVYYGWYSAGKYELRKIATSGGAPTTLRTPWEGVLTVAGGTLLFTDCASNGTDCDVYAMPTAGGAARVVAGGASGAGDITADATYVYWVSAYTSRVSRALLAGGPVEVIANMQDDPQAIAVDDKWIYWANYTDTSASLAEACK